MNHPPACSFNELVAHYLGGRLPKEMAAAISFPELPADVHYFILRMLILMRRAGFPAMDFTPTLIWQLSHVIPGFLPCAWGGRAPPLTLAKRNAKIDTYVIRHAWPDELVDPVLVDMGCGFPPITTTETAETLSGWRIFGVDRSFFDYVLHEGDGTYACFDSQGTFQYFQPRMDHSGVWMYRNQAETRLRFERIFGDLLPLLSKRADQADETVKRHGNTLIRHPIQKYESSNLTFIESAMEEAPVPPAHAIRCMNLLLYFEPQTRQCMLVRAGTRLVHCGIMIAGSNLMSGACCRYTVYTRDNQSIDPVEFALSLDNLGPTGVMPWYTLHDDDPEAMLLADVIRQIRADGPFWRRFSERLDKLMAHYGLFERHSNGFLYASEGERPITDFAERLSRLWLQVEEEGFAGGAVDALNRAGYVAWINQVGDIALRPNFSRLNLAGRK